MKSAVPVLAALLCLAPFSRADELRLKDGSKVTGKIVGFEDNSFKVETSYGYALVRKDQVASITVIDDAKKPAATSKSAMAPAGKSRPTAEESASLKTSTSEVKAANAAAGALSSAAERKDAPGADGIAANTTNGVAGAANQPSGSSGKAPTEPEASAATPVVPADSASPATFPAAVAHAPRASRKGAVASAITKPASTASPAPPANPASTASPAAAASKPVPVTPALAQPEPVHEQVVGNSYNNDTYGFRMYKPPDWEVIADAHKMLPGSIVAMGTSDQTTYLIIAQESLVGSLEAQWTPTERRLQSTVENYRPLGAKRVVVSGLPAIQSRFRGSLDNHDWSGSVTLIARDNQLFTIFGMTSADSDLVQIQENVIARTVASLQFGKPPLASKSR
jgi:hypothetical protein